MTRMVGGSLPLRAGEVVEGVHRRVVRSVEVGDLTEGMDPGVGAASVVNADRLFNDLGKSSLESILDGAAFGWVAQPRKGRPS